MSFIVRIEIRGLKRGDIDIDLAARQLITGPVGAGKSMIGDALRFAVLGFVPAYGRSESSTADMMSGREMGVRVFLDDGRWFKRVLTKVGRSNKIVATCSWLGEKTSSTEVGESIHGLFGASEAEAAEHLDLREFLIAGPSKRDGRLAAMLDKSGMPLEEQIAFTRSMMVYRLSGMSKKAPEDRKRLVVAASGLEIALDDDLRKALAPCIAEVELRLKDKSIGDALVLAGTTKMKLAGEQTKKVAARREIEERLGPMSATTLEALARAQLERQERLAVLRDRVSAHERTAATRDQTTARLDAVVAAKASRETRLAEALLALTEPEVAPENRPEVPEPPPPLVESEAVAEEVRRMVERAEAIRAKLEVEEREDPRPEPAALEIPPFTEVVASMLAEAEERLRLALESPWSEVREIAGKIKGFLDVDDCPPQFRVVALVAFNRLDALAAQHGGDIGPLRVAVEEAKAALALANEELAAATKRNRAAQDRAASDLMEWNARAAGRKTAAWEAEATFKKAASNKAAERSRVEKTNAAATKAHKTAVAAWKKACGVVATARHEAVAARDKRLAEARGRVDAIRLEESEEARLRALLQGLEASTQATMDDVRVEAEALTKELEGLGEARKEAEGREARARELDRLTLELIDADIQHKLWSACEWALRELRQRDMAERAGPIRDHVRNFLRAAGWSEEPYLRAKRGKIEFGWVRGEREIPLRTLSGGEMVFVVAALSSAIIAIRKPQAACLVLEGAEVGIALASRLMEACATTAVPNAIISTCLPVDPVAGWVKLERKVVESEAGGAQ